MVADECTITSPPLVKTNTPSQKWGRLLRFGTAKMLNIIKDSEWPAAIEDMREGFAGGLNVYRTMAHHPKLLRSWANFRNHIVLDSALGSQMSEVVILRCGLNLGSEYEWAHHVYRARKLGMGDALIQAISGDGVLLPQDIQLLMRATDQLFAYKKLLPKTQTALSLAFGTEAMLDVMATVAHYSLLGFILNSFNVEIDANVAAQEPLEALPFAPLLGDVE